MSTIWYTSFFPKLSPFFTRKWCSRSSLWRIFKEKETRWSEWGNNLLWEKLYHRDTHMAFILSLLQYKIVSFYASCSKGFGLYMSIYMCVCVSMKHAKKLFNASYNDRMQSQNQGKKSWKKLLQKLNSKRYLSLVITLTSYKPKLGYWVIRPVL